MLELAVASETELANIKLSRLQVLQVRFFELLLAKAVDCPDEFKILLFVEVDDILHLLVELLCWVRNAHNVIGIDVSLSDRNVDHLRFFRAVEELLSVDSRKLVQLADWTHKRVEHHGLHIEELASLSNLFVSQN